MLNLPRIKNCQHLRDLIVQQGNNFAFWHLKKFDQIQFKTTERELNEVFNRNAAEKDKQSLRSKDIGLIDDDNNVIGNEDNDDDDIQWI